VCRGARTPPRRRCELGRASAAPAGAQLAPITAPVRRPDRDHGWVAGPDNSLLSQPSNAILKALSREDLHAKQLDLIEINEAVAAVAAVALQSINELGVDSDLVKPDGGAISLGHPVGASGARSAIHLAHELKRRGAGVGAAGPVRRRPGLDARAPRLIPNPPQQRLGDHLMAVRERLRMPEAGRGGIRAVVLDGSDTHPLIGVRRASAQWARSARVGVGTLTSPALPLAPVGQREAHRGRTKG
jgi:hypothetical protein